MGVTLILAAVAVVLFGFYLVAARRPGVAAIITPLLAIAVGAFVFKAFVTSVAPVSQKETYIGLALGALATLLVWGTLRRRRG